MGVITGARLAGAERMPAGRFHCADVAMAMLVRQVAQRPEIRLPDEVLALRYSKLAVALRQTEERDRAEEAARNAEQERIAVRRTP